MKSQTRVLCAVLIAGGLIFAGTALAQASFADKAQLIQALSTRPPCCVIDGRAADMRKKAPLENALHWRSDLQINPTATVVVIADRDQDALGIGQALARKHPGKPILVAKGGLATWKSASLALMAGAGMDVANSSGIVSFVIPANTCEQGKPLQELRPDKR